MAHQAGKCRWKLKWGSPGGAAKGMAALLGLALGVYVLGPPLYWQVAEGMASHAASCPACICDCPSESLLTIPTGLGNASIADCVKHDPELSEEIEKNYTDLLSEELKLQETVAAEAQERADMALLEAKKLASQYQKEAEKCNAGMETCEEARERAEATLIAEKKLSASWEQRAHQMGWKEEMAKYDNTQTRSILHTRNAVEMKAAI